MVVEFLARAYQSLVTPRERLEVGDRNMLCCIVSYSTLSEVRLNTDSDENLNCTYIYICM